MSEELEVAAPAVKSKAGKGKTLQMEYDTFDPVGEGQWYRVGDMVETVTPYLQSLLDSGFAKLV